MATLITADLHFSDNARDAYRFDFVDRLFKILEKKSIDRLFILGDLTEEKDRHSAWLVNTVSDYIFSLSKVCPIYFLKGNHDYLDASSPFFEFIKYLGNDYSVNWISTPYSTSFEDLGNCLFLPHTSNYERDWRNISFKNTDYIFAHNTFKGTKNNVGFEMDGVPVTVFPKNSTVISGDIHNPQKVGPVTYVGSPYLVDFGDDYKPRVLIIDDDGSIESLISKGPQKRLVTIDNPNKIRRTLDCTKVYKNDVLKVRIKVDAESYQNWHKYKDKVNAWAETNSCWVYMVQPVMDKIEKTARIKTKRELRSDEEILQTYAEQRDLPNGTLKAGLRLLDK